MKKENLIKSVTLKYVVCSVVQQYLEIILNCHVKVVLLIVAGY